MFTITQGFPTNITSPFVPFFNTLVQVTFGVGLPVALQSKVRFELSLTVWSPLGLPVKLASTEKNAIKSQPSCRYVWKAHEYTNLNNRLSDKENRFKILFPFSSSREKKTLTETNLHLKFLPTHEHDKDEQLILSKTDAKRMTNYS